MGIWNSTEIRFDGELSSLITPHGDLELSISARPTPISEPHNPSWGFGTSLRSPAAQTVLQLITPHGDLELNIFSAPLVHLLSHNPSWGFGTENFDILEGLETAS